MKMFKPPLRPDYPTIPVFVLVIVCSLFVLALGIWGILTVHQALVEGWIYFGGKYHPGGVLHRETSPLRYWITVGLVTGISVVMIPLALFSLVFLPINYIKKFARKKTHHGVKQ